MNETTRNEIEKTARKTLKDSGIVHPPVHIEVLMEHLRLYRDFYNLQSPTFLDKAKYKIRVHGRKMVDIIRKINLVAVLLYDEERIVVDANLPEIKWDWSTSHEISHRILRWHRPYFYGDTAQTLDPDWHEILELEANYCASELMFCGNVFKKEACEVGKNWESVALLKKRYGKSWTTTLRRYVEHGHDHAMVMLVSTPYWKVKPADQPERWRYFIKSKKFIKQFSNIKPEQVLTKLDDNSNIRRGGIVADFTFPLIDDNGVLHEFHAESFYNTHYLLTLCVQTRKCASKRIILL